LIFFGDVSFSSSLKVIPPFLFLEDNFRSFDSSLERDPLSIKIGTGGVIPGFEEALRGLCPGQQRRVTIPPELAYGDKGVPPHIPPKSTLIFELECLNVDRPSFGRDLIPFLQSISPFLAIIAIIIYIFSRAKETSVKESNTSKKVKSVNKRKPKTK